MFTVIQNGKVFDPLEQGITSLLLWGEKIVKQGRIDIDALYTAGLLDKVIDAGGCMVIPGLIDPHQHLIGAGGENGFTSRLPEVRLEDIVQSGITTVVGLLGTDTVTRSPFCLYAKVQQLNDDGLTSYMYTGGFEIPPTTITQSVIDDLVMIQPVIGTGEVAISDTRWLDPKPHDLAHVISQTQLGGRMSGKAGVTHFHVGELDQRLSLLFEVIDKYKLDVKTFYVTHITRNVALLEEAIELARRGAYVDMDTVEEDTAKWVNTYQQKGGDLTQLTISSDAHTPGGSPQKLWSAFVDCLQESTLSREQVIQLFSSNAAKVLKLKDKGHLCEGADADIVIMREADFVIEHVFARGKHFIENGELVQESQQETLLKEGQPS